MFDTSFRTFATPALVQVIYAVAVALFLVQAVAVACGCVWLAGQDLDRQLKIVIALSGAAATIYLLFVLLWLRVILEALVIVFRCEEHLDELRRKE